jgi:hypothetical protein
MPPRPDLERQEVKRLIELMRDPRYWRDRDPEVRRIVHSGFRRLYRCRAGATHSEGLHSESAA